MFQFTHPGGVRPLHDELCIVTIEFQFTHPGGVRQETSESKTRARSVSIHAPGRGATFYILHIWERNRVSIHAPGRGAT